jgi:hypothetical protein
MSRTRRRPPGRDRESGKRRGTTPAKRPPKGERAREELEWDDDEAVDDEQYPEDVEDPNESLEEAVDDESSEDSWDDEEPTERAG